MDRGELRDGRVIRWIRSALTARDPADCPHSFVVHVRAGENSGLDWPGEALVYGSTLDFESCTQSSCVEILWCCKCGELGVVSSSLEERIVDRGPKGTG